MSLTLYTHPVSDFGQRVHFFLEEAEIPYEYRAINFSQDTKSWELISSLTPFRRVPTLQDGDFGLGESCAIMRYLIAKYSLHQYYPLALQDRAQCDMWLDFINMHVTDPLSTLAWYRTWAVHYGQAIDPWSIADATKNLARTLPKVEAHLATHNYFCGPSLTIVDFAFMPVAHTIEAAQLPPRDTENIRRWHSRIVDRPSWQKVAVKIAEAKAAKGM